MIEVEGENMRGVTWVRVNEFESGDWAIGGKALKTSDVQALAAEKAACAATRLNSQREGGACIRPPPRSLGRVAPKADVD
jgi:hypothetical protein